MASISKKPRSPYWWAWYLAADGKPTSKSTKILVNPPDANLRQANYNAALGIAEGFERQAKAGLPVGALATQPSDLFLGIPTWKEFAQDWLCGVGGDADYRHKLSGYLDRVDEFLAAKIAWQICQLHRPDFAGLAQFISVRGYSPTTVTAHLKLLRQVFLAAYAKGFVLECPITIEDYVKNPSPRLRKRLTVEQIQHLLNTTSVIDWRTLLLFGFYLGMDLMEAVRLQWTHFNFAARTVSWTHFARADQRSELTLPIHPVVEQHLLLVKMIARSEFVMASLHDLSEAALREHFRRLVADAGLRTGSVISPLNKKYSPMQFSSLKLAFAQEIGHQGIFRLSRFIHSLSPEALEAKVATLPNLELKPLPLLAAAKI